MREHPEARQPHGASHVPPPPGDLLDRTRFPADEWRLVESRPDSRDLGVTESLFSLGNGYLGLRGNYEESRDFHSNGTYVNGFHETWPIQHAEEAFGFARVGQTIVNAPDAKVIRLYVDDEPLQVSAADLEEYERALDLRTGVLTRTLLWRTPSGKRVRVVTRRMVSFTQRHLAVMTMEVTLLDASAPVTISSQLLNRQDGASETKVLSAAGRPGHGPAQGGAVQPPGAGAGRPGRRRGDRPGGARLPVRRQRDDDRRRRRPPARDRQRDSGVRVESSEDLAKATFRVQAERGKPITLTKTVSYHTAAPCRRASCSTGASGPSTGSLDEGVEQHFADQSAYLADFWARCDVEIPGQPEVQQAVRWNLFSLLQASARADGAGIPAKGVTGSGYGGHYFWDTEIFVMPFLTYTMPGAARNALRFRYSLLDAARTRARELTQKGALFPWRTINGVEASAYYAAGTAQYHIDADIAYALSQYVGATGDIDFLHQQAIDIFVETARLWADLGFWRDEQHRRLPHPRRHRPRRVHDRGQRQPLHERDGALQPPPGRAGGALARRAGPPGVRRDGATRGPRRRGGGGVVARGAGDDDPLRRAPRHPPAGLPLPRARDVGPRPDADRKAAAAAQLPPAGDLPLPGAQAGRRRARALPPGRGVHDGAEEGRLRLLRPDHHR